MTNRSTNHPTLPKKVKLIGKPRAGRFTVIPVKVARSEPLNCAVLTTLGEAIKTVRIMRVMSQRELGIALGFSADNADIRVSQYESGSRTPRADLLQKMQQVLNCEFNQKSCVECVLLDENN